MLAPQRPRDLLAPAPSPGGVGMTVGQMTPAAEAFWQIAVPVSAAVSTYHGYKRNYGSLGWALGWGALGAIFPIITPAVALAQGFAKPGPR